MKIVYNNVYTFEFINLTTKLMNSHSENYRLKFVNKDNLIRYVSFNDNEWYREEYNCEYREGYDIMRNMLISKAKTDRIDHKHDVFSKLNFIRTLIHPDVIAQVVISLNKLLPIHYLETV